MLLRIARSIEKHFPYTIKDVLIKQLLHPYNEFHTKIRILEYVSRNANVFPSRM